MRASSPASTSSQTARVSPPSSQRRWSGGIGRRYLAGLELGNEPEVYGTLGWYGTPAGVGVPGRPASYDFGAYLRDYARVSKALSRGVPLAGPASGAQGWLAGLGRYLSVNPRVRLVTFHRYPLQRCFTPPTSPAFPTISNLLAPAAATGPATSLATAIGVAHARGIPLRVDELNSVSCGGARGVSDTLASALWVLDTLLNLARVGVDGVNIHTFHRAIYEPFDVSEHGGRWSGEVRPLYYGLLMFARAAPPRSRLLPASYRGPSTLRIWSTRAPGGSVRVVLINDSRRDLGHRRRPSSGPGLGRRRHASARPARQCHLGRHARRAVLCHADGHRPAGRERAHAHIAPRPGAARGPPAAGLGDAADRHGA